MVRLGVRMTADRKQPKDDVAPTAGSENPLTGAYLSVFLLLSNEFPHRKVEWCCIEKGSMGLV